MTPEQKQKILDNAPEGATHYVPGKPVYYKVYLGHVQYYNTMTTLWVFSDLGMNRLKPLDSLREPTENWSEADEARMDIIGSNGPSGLHYQSASAPDFLQAALKHMQDRAKTYDKPKGERSMGATVAAFHAVTGIALTEEQGWLLMILLKAVRSQQGEYKADNYEDGAAYFGLCGEAASKERVK
jgi:hypothetical protein